MHEQGQRHKQAERDFLFNQRKQKHDEKHAQSELQNALAEIEAAAAEAVARDYAPAGPAGAHTAPVPRAPHGGCAPRGGGQGHGQGQRGGAAPPPPPPAQEDLGDGVYSSKGMLYLMGEHDSARARLVTGSDVEVLSGNDWSTATITAVQEVAVAYTKIVLRRYDMHVHGSDPAAVLRGVQASSLRLPLTATQAESLRAAYRATQAGDHAEAPSQSAEPVPEGPKYEIDPNTGLGKWTSLEVPSVDDGHKGERADPGRAEDAQATATSRKRPFDTSYDAEDALQALHHDPSKALDLLAQKRAKLASMQAISALKGYDDSTEHAEGALDALAAFNPHAGAGGGPRLYKGIALAGDEAEDVDAQGADAPRHLARVHPLVAHGTGTTGPAPTVKVEKSQYESGQRSSFPAVASLQPVVSGVHPAAEPALSTSARVQGRRPPANFKARKRDDDE